MTRGCRSGPGRASSRSSPSPAPRSRPRSATTRITSLRTAGRIVNPPCRPQHGAGGPRGQARSSRPRPRRTRQHHPCQLLHDERRPAAAATRTSTSSGTPPRTTSRRSTTSGTASPSSTCRTRSARSPRNGARVPRPGGLLQRPLRPPDQGADPHARGAGGARLHLAAIRSCTCRSTMGQGDFTIEYPPLHDLAASKNPVLRVAARLAVYARPRAPPARRSSSRFHRSRRAEFCSSCHKVHLDVPGEQLPLVPRLQRLRHLAGSAASRAQGARVVLLPAEAAEVRDCHMPLVASKDPGERDGKVHSHRFPAANTALPFVNRDDVQLEIAQEFLQDGQSSRGHLRPRRGRRRKAPARAQARPRAASRGSRARSRSGEESRRASAPRHERSCADAAPTSIAPLDKRGAAVRRGRVRCASTSSRARARSATSSPAARSTPSTSGSSSRRRTRRARDPLPQRRVADDGQGPGRARRPLLPRLLLDDHGNRINKRNAWAARSVAYVRLIPPGAADTVHFRLQSRRTAAHRSRSTRE